MRVEKETKRWGEVTIKEQGIKKNHFDSTKSFSILNSKNHYDIQQLKDIYELVTNLTEKHTFDELKKILKGGEK